MSDNSYGVEIKPANKNGWFTPAESEAYYGRYFRDAYIVHWWGLPGHVGTHDATVRYILGTAAAGNMSVNYVLSNDKISLLVNPDDVSWGAQGGNPIGVNVEHEPTLNDEGYKKSGWLKEQLEQRFGHALTVRKHSDFFGTQCPGTISLDRIEQECDKWRRKAYDAPIIPPSPQTPPIVITDKPQRLMYTLANAKLVNIDDLSVVRTYPVNTPMQVAAEALSGGKKFLLTPYARSKGTEQGFLVGDLKQFITPTPTQPTPPVYVPPTAPEWVSNLRDIDDTDYWFKSDTNLVDITTGNVLALKVFKKDGKFTSSALTKVGAIEYRITDYSFKKGIFNGVPVSKLTLTEPGVPNIPPVPDFEKRLSALELLVARIVNFLSSLFSGFSK